MSKARTAHPRAATLAPLPVPILATSVIALLRDLWHDLFDSYRPEQHYMRGPGPAWQAKHAAARPGDR
jgi:hypothetical protein